MDGELYETEPFIVTVLPGFKTMMGASWRDDRYEALNNKSLKTI